jgi:hypothetical protein
VEDHVVSDWRAHDGEVLRRQRLVALWHFGFADHEAGRGGPVIGRRPHGQDHLQALALLRKHGGRAEVHGLFDGAGRRAEDRAGRGERDHGELLGEDDLHD